MGATVVKQRSREWASAHRPFLLSLLVSMGLVIVAAVVLRATGSERRALMRLPAEQRKTLYEATLRDTEAVCNQADVNMAFRSRCADSARFLLAFPECDDACRAYAHRFAREPAR